MHIFNILIQNIIQTFCALSLHIIHDWITIMGHCAVIMKLGQ